MPPKKNVSKNALKVDEDPNKLYEVDKEFFKIQFEDIEKKISRLNDDSKVLENDIETFKIKTIDANNKFKDEYEFKQNILEEKKNIEQKLKNEIEELLMQSKSVSEDRENIKNKLHNEFIIESRKINAKTSVFVGKVNKFEEYARQEDILVKKLADMKAEIQKSNENYEINLAKIEEKKYQNKKSVRRRFIERVVNFKEQSILDEDPALIASIINLNNVVDMLNASEELNAKLEKDLRDCKDVKYQRKRTKVPMDRNADQALNVHVLQMEDVLLKIYEEVEVHMKQMIINGESNMENMMEFLEKLSELKPLTIPE